jgi:ketosteroid isomerase-like protein
MRAGGMTNHLFAGACLLMILSAFCGCTQGEALPAEELSRLTRTISTHLLERDYEGLTDWFTDSAQILSPGGYRVQGREVIGDFWRRYHQPIAWTSRTRGVTRDTVLLLPDGDWSTALGAIPATVYREVPVQGAFAWLWAEWDIRYVDQTGMSRQDHMQVLLHWVETPQREWRIQKLYFR